ncbi:hypothetical protein ACFGVS_25505 [Mucilaginibacter sp. AW1-7]|uniref:hypothetical protein n=1 Tax=Mucilaginibacter sp. AW1-7 TaxID=3349874 RepID=UPI003F73F9B5
MLRYEVSINKLCWRYAWRTIDPSLSLWKTENETCHGEERSIYWRTFISVMHKLIDDRKIGGIVGEYKSPTMSAEFKNPH